MPDQMGLRRVQRSGYLGVPSSLKVQRGNTWTLDRRWLNRVLARTISFSWRQMVDIAQFVWMYWWHSAVEQVGFRVTQLGEATENPWRLKVLNWTGKLACIQVTKIRIEGCSEPKPRFLRFLLSNFGSVWFFTPTWAFSFADILSTKKSQ